MKKFYSLFIVALLFVIIFSSVSVWADTVGDVVISLKIDNPIMTVNGENRDIDEGRDTKPVILNDRTLVPIRAIIEAFGGGVYWDEATSTVTLTMEEDVIRLTINDYTAYLNNMAKELDVSPTVINDRTMLPIRFIAEGFNIGVAWNNDTQTVSLIRNTFDDYEYEYLMSILPAYSGSPYVELNGNIPFFKSYEKIESSFEYYSKLDELGRCDVCIASVGTDIMPAGERESISSVFPSGWINASYDAVSGGYLYNRCHLIGYQLTGENANDRNLITGTRYLNIDGMLPFENRVDDYIDSTGNNVIYRSTPVFKENNLVADGVLLEAYSVEDNGEGISFCVYCYNVQPDIYIDYLTGESYQIGGGYQEEVTPSTGGIYRTPTGKRYHLDPDCGGKNSYSVTYDQAISAGLTPCQKCAK